MHIRINRHAMYADTAGKALCPDQPTAVLIHGVLCDHSVWTAQGGCLARDGWNVLAIDLPGHGRSQGPAPTSVEEAARCVAALLDAAGLAQVALIGHSWGSLIALQAAADLGRRVSHLALLGIAHPMTVSPALLETALHQPEQAIAMISTFSRATQQAPSDGDMAEGRRILASNPRQNLLHTGLLACDRYRGGEAAIAAIASPVLFLLGAQDRMTPTKRAQRLMQAAEAADKRVTHVLLPTGHHLMTEAADETLCALRDFLHTA